MEYVSFLNRIICLYFGVRNNKNCSYNLASWAQILDNSSEEAVIRLKHLCFCRSAHLPVWGNTQCACTCMCRKTLNEIFLPEITCSCKRKSRPHTCQSLSWPDAHSKRAFLVHAHSYFIEDFQAGGMAFLSHVLAEQPTGTFHQSADWDGSSGIILTVNPARIRLYSATQH